jgi:hypothetical protein
VVRDVHVGYISGLAGRFLTCRMCGLKSARYKETLLVSKLLNGESQIFRYLYNPGCLRLEKERLLLAIVVSGN